MKIKEQEVDVKKVIKDLQGNFAGDNENQMKGVQLLKGLATSEEDISNEFMKKLDTATTEISKEILGEEKKESRKLKKVIVPRGEQLNLGNVILESGDTYYVELKEGYDTIPSLEKEAFRHSIDSIIETILYVVMRKNITEENGKYEKVVDLMYDARSVVEHIRYAEDEY